MRRRCFQTAIAWSLLVMLPACAAISTPPALLNQANEKTETAQYYYTMNDYLNAKVIAEEALAAWLTLRDQGASSAQPWLIDQKITECRKIIRACDNPSTVEIKRKLRYAWDLYLKGDFRKARSTYEQYAEICEKKLGPNHPLLAHCLGSLGNVYQAVGAYDRAEPILHRALAIREKVPLEKTSGGLASSLHDLAWLYECRGEFEKAIPLYQRARALPGYWNPILLENNLASCYVAQGRIDEACRVFKKTGLALGLGACHYFRGEYEEALHNLRRALENKDRRIKGARELALICMGMCNEAQGDLTMAQKQFEKAIDGIEVMWRTLESFDRKNFLGANMGGGFRRLDAYEGIIRILMKRKQGGYERKSLHYAEMVKSRTFLEMLAAKQVQGLGDVHRGVLQRDRHFQKGISELRKRLMELQARGTALSERETKQLEHALTVKGREYEHFINEVKLKDAELASLISVEVAPVERVQALLEPGLTVLEYFTSREETYVWMITREKILTQVIPVGSANLTEKVNNLILNNISNQSRRRKPLIVIAAADIPSRNADLGQGQDNPRRFLVLSKEIYNLLIQPLEKGIRGKRLLIVPHGALHKIPFAVLHNGQNFLLDKYALGVVPSLSVIEYVVRKRNRNNKRLLAMADPQTDYIPLEFAEKEVDQISGHFPQSELYFHEEATETRVKTRSSTHDVLHFATHGEFNDRQPMQSGLLLTCDNENDGFLQVHEIFGLDLREANLVTLSACDTALSRIYSGDDLVGLSRAFLYAGAPTLLATLWPVQDRSTYLLMTAFYENWQAKDFSPPEALRRAQIQLRSSPEFEHPFHWAPFILIGDWR